jgi:hypothetical protein
MTREGGTDDQPNRWSSADTTMSAQARRAASTWISF